MHNDTDNELNSPPFEKERVEAALIKAEQRRKTILSASIFFSFAIAFTVFQLSFFDIAVIGSYIAALLAAVMCWKLCSWMWRSVAICSIAPEIGGRYGQLNIQNAWELLTLEDWFKATFIAKDRRSTTWKSEGTYRDVAYRLSEVSVTTKNIGQGRSPNPPTFMLVAEISVPVSFTGCIEIRPHTPVLGQITSFIQHILGDDSRCYTGDQHFDEMFETYVKNNSHYQELLSPAFRKCLLNITRYGLRSEFSGRFEAGSFYLEFPVKTTTFKNASLLKPMPALINETQELWWDLTLPQRLIDGLTGDYDGPLH